MGTPSKRVAPQPFAAFGSDYSTSLFVFFHQPGQRGERVVGGLGDFRAAGGTVRKVLLADEPAWAALLRECLAPMGDGAVLISAPNWDSVSRLFDDDHGAVLLTTPHLQPGPGRCSLPCVLLLEQEPLVSPLGVSDWLVLSALDSGCSLPR